MTQERCVFLQSAVAKTVPWKPASASPCLHIGGLFFVYSVSLCLSAVGARAEEIWDVCRRDNVEDFVLYRDLSSWMKVLRKHWDCCVVLLTEGSRRGLKRDVRRVRITINLRPKYKNQARQNIHYTFLKLKIVLFFSRCRLRPLHTYTLSHTQTQARLSSLTTVKKSLLFELTNPGFSSITQYYSSYEIFNRLSAVCWERGR